MNKRQFLTTAGLGAAVVADRSIAQPEQKANCSINNLFINRNAKTFVLVHGGWAGGWMYKDVATLLRSQGHIVYTPTNTGLCERKHLLGPDVDLTTHIMDIVNLVEAEELNNVVLAGHSSGGIVITGVADRIANKISSIVYLDAFIPEDGMDFFDVTLPPGQSAGARDAIKGMFASGQHGFVIPGLDEATGAQSYQHRFTPQPIGFALEKISLTGAYKSIAKKTYVWASLNPLAVGTPYYNRLVKDSSWRTEVYEGNHNIMMDAPEVCAEILLRAA